MTNERAILRLEMLYENCQEEMCEGACVYCLDAIKKATEALEQELEEDCISMQAAIDVVRQYCIDNQIEDGDYHANGIKYELKELPSAQPEPKRGKWIDVSERGSWSIKKACDQCGEIVFQPNYNYCPNCGARMESDEE